MVGTFLLPGWHARRAGGAAEPPAHRASRRRTAGRRPPPPLVMLDPGHGGKDPGAIGVSGTYEKHVALATAQELRRQLEAERPLPRRADPRRAMCSSRWRSGWRSRRRMAPRLFVSMHADALSDHAVRGASVYTLADTRSDAQTAALAQRENSADRFGGPDCATRRRRWRRSWPAWCAQETRVGSARLARDLVGSLDQDLPMLPNPARHAGFVVLKAADIPSVLVEMGFMSNPPDEAALRRPQHRALVAAAMKRAVDAYFAASRAHCAG